VIRTHDVAATMDALTVAQAIWNARVNPQSRDPQ